MRCFSCEKLFSPNVRFKLIYEKIVLERLSKDGKEKNVSGNWVERKGEKKKKKRKLNKWGTRKKNNNKKCPLTPVSQLKIVDRQVS